MKEIKITSEALEDIGNFHGFDVIAKLEEILLKDCILMKERKEKLEKIMSNINGINV